MLLLRQRLLLQVGAHGGMRVGHPGGEVRKGERSHVAVDQRRVLRRCAVP